MDAAALLSAASGALVGLVLGVIGGGGSILAVPLLVYVVGFRGDAHVAIGTTALAVAVTALVGLARHHQAGRVRPGVGLLFALPGIPGALLGARLGLATPPGRLLAAFAALMLVVAVVMWRRKEPTSAPAGAASPRLRVAPVLAAGFLVGVTSGYFGIGGGFLIVPALVLAAGLEVRAAMATSLLVVAAFGFTTSARYAAAGMLDLPIAALFIAGGVAGSLAGAHVAHAAPRALLQKVFAGVLAMVALYMLWTLV